VDTAEVDTTWYLAQLSQEKVAGLFKAATVEMAARVGEGVEAWQAGTTAAQEADVNGKFVDGKCGGRQLFGWWDVLGFRMCAGWRRSFGSTRRRRVSPSQTLKARDPDSRLPASDDSYFLLLSTRTLS